MRYFVTFPGGNEIPVDVTHLPTGAGEVVVHPRGGAVQQTRQVARQVGQALEVVLGKRQGQGGQHVGGGHRFHSVGHCRGDHNGHSCTGRALRCCAT